MSSVFLIFFHFLVMTFPLKYHSKTRGGSLWRKKPHLLICLSGRFTLLRGVLLELFAPHVSENQEPLSRFMINKAFALIVIKEKNSNSLLSVNSCKDG